MMVDTGAVRIAINKEIKTQPCLKKGLLINVALADGSIQPIELVSGVKVTLGDRAFYTDLFVLPDGTEPLLGPIPLLGMDLVVILSKNKLENNPKNPDGAIFSLKKFNR